MPDYIRCRHCKKVVGNLQKTGRENMGIPEYSAQYTHASLKVTRPFPNKRITSTDRFCDYCGKPIF